VRRRFAVIVVALAASLSACAQPGYSARKLERQLVSAGLSDAEARCVTRTLENTYDEGQLGSRSEPTQREFDKTRSILVETCKIDPKKLNPLP
jgi:hypothetical protein